MTPEQQRIADLERQLKRAQDKLLRAKILAMQWRSRSGGFSGYNEVPARDIYTKCATDLHRVLSDDHW